MTVLVNTPIPPVPTTLSENTIQGLETWALDLLHHTESLKDSEEGCHKLQEDFTAGSCGSKTYGTNGAFGWSISTENGENVALGMRPSQCCVMN